MNNYAREWTVRKEISNAVQNGNLNDWFENMFSSTIGGVEMKQLLEFSRIKKGSNGKFEYPNLWNNRAIDYKNFTSNYHNYTHVSERMDPNQFIHYIDSLRLAKYSKWNSKLS